MTENTLVSLIKKMFKNGNNIVKNSIRIDEENYETQQFQDEFLENKREKEREGNYDLDEVSIVDKRENIVTVESYMIKGGYLTIRSSSEKRKEIYKDIVRYLNDKLELGEEVNNKKISISRNYVSKENQGKNGEGIWGGWHSLAEDKVSKANNFKYYIFCVREETIYYTIVFEKESFQNYLKLKELDKSGKYNFYFTGFA